MSGAQWQANPWRGLRVLNLGCGGRPIGHAINHDRAPHGDWVDLACDLDDMPWVFTYHTPNGETAPQEYDVVCAFDLVEHLEDPYGFVNECYPLLTPGGRLVFRTAAFDNPATYADLTHKHWANADAFDFFDRTTERGEHYSSFHPVDGLGRLPTHWRIEEVKRVNPDHRWLDHGDWQFTLVKL